MSDIEKVHARADQLGPGTPIRLRWEGAGDSVHAANLLSSLKNRSYQGTTTRIKYAATINLYEAEDSPIFAAASKLLASVHGWGTNRDQTYVMRGDVDVTRTSRSLNQEQAHIMFVRNIMPTNELGESLTREPALLQDIHTRGIRGRANSLAGDGQLRLGMSGAPGLASASQNARMNMQVQNLFVGSGALVNAGRDAGLRIANDPYDLGKTDFDAGGVMKNNGRDLGIKPTYYLTFMQ